MRLALDLTRTKAKLDALPKKISLYTDQGLMLLPGGRISLLIEHDDEIELIEKAIRQNRFIGVAQCIESDTETIPFETGCLSRITSFNETDEGMLLILKGICRFDVVSPINPDAIIQRADVDYSRYAADLSIKARGDSVDRDRLMRALGNYMEQFEVHAEWAEILETPDDKLVTALAMSGPFSPLEKQALLETPTLPEQCCILSTLMEMALLDTNQTYQ